MNYLHLYLVSSFHTVQVQALSTFIDAMSSTVGSFFYCFFRQLHFNIPCPKHADLRWLLTGIHNFCSQFYRFLRVTSISNAGHLHCYLHLGQWSAKCLILSPAGTIGPGSPVRMYLASPTHSLLNSPSVWCLTVAHQSILSLLLYRSCFLWSRASQTLWFTVTPAH